MSHRRVFTALILIFSAIPLLASGPTGSITGTITDPTGAVIPKAKITVVNEATNSSRHVATNSDGDYTVTLLPPGRYKVTVEMQGFRRSVSNHVNLDVDQTARVDFKLVVGAVTEEVTVTDAPPIVQTDNSTLGQVMGTHLVEELPLNQRNFLNFTLLVPGAQLPSQGSQNSTQGGAINVNGARDQSNSFLLDGVENNDPYLNQYAALPSVDAIQEFKVQSSSYSAEYGHAGGAQVNVVLKSGSNNFHGGIFEFLRNRTMDAKNYFDLADCSASNAGSACGPIPRLDRNQFGGTLGGPIRKDKTFFFVSDEHQVLRQADTKEASVPSVMQWEIANGVADSLFGCPNNPSCAIGQNVEALYPAANVGTDLINSNTFLSAPVIRNSLNMLTAKVDQQINPDDKLSIHYSMSNQDEFSPFDMVNSFTSLPGYGSYTRLLGQNAGVDWTRVWRSSIVNEFRLGFTRMGATFLQQDYGQDVASQLGFPDVLTGKTDLGVPNINVLNFDGIGEPVQYPQNRRDNTYQISDTLAWTVGQNDLKIGADFRRQQLGNYLDFLARGDWYFLGDTVAGILGYYGDPTPCATAPPDDPISCSLAQLLGGVPDYALAVSGNSNNDLHSYGVSAYVQDNIHVVPRFVLNAGLRYEFNGPAVEAHNQFSVPNLIPCPYPCALSPTFTLAGTNGIPDATYYPTFRDVAPRLGFSWRPLKSERWVVRAAYGIFFDVTIANVNFFPRINPPFFGLAAYFQTPTCPGGLCTVQDLLLQTGQQSGVVQGDMIDRHIRDGYMQQWNLNLQYEVQPNWMIDVAYVGSKGTHLSNVVDQNQSDPVSGPPYGQFSSLLTVESTSASTYHSLQLRSERRVSHGLAFIAAYTWSRSIDDISSVFSGTVGSGLPQNSKDLSADRGPSDFNATHRLSVSAVYDLPLGSFTGKKSELNKQLLENWQAGAIFSGQSGSPFTVTLPGASAASAAAFGNPARPDLVGNPFSATSGGCNVKVKTVANWFNPCAFALPAQQNFGYAFGTEGRNALVGPGFIDFDLSLSKKFQLRSESHSLVFRAEVFNLFNHPNFDDPNHILGTANFDSILSANSYQNKPPRQIQVGFKYDF